MFPSMINVTNWAVQHHPPGVPFPPVSTFVPSTLGVEGTGTGTDGKGGRVVYEYLELTERE